MALFAYNDPMLSDVERTIDRMFDRGFGRWMTPTRGTAGDVAGLGTDIFGDLATAGRHAFDIVEKKDGYELIADAPGFTANDIKVDLDKNVLTVSGQVEKQDEKREGRVWRSERRMQRFQRSFTVPEDVKTEQIAASLDKGVLTVHLPKAPEAAKPQPKRIEVKPAA